MRMTVRFYTVGSLRKEAGTLEVERDGDWSPRDDDFLAQFLSTMNYHGFEFEITVGS